MQHPTFVKRAVVWLGFVILCNGVGYLSSLAGTEARVYSELAQPSWAPPGWLFAPVWTTLYTLMGTGAYLVWRQARSGARRRALGIFAIQLALNAMWTPVFFGLQRYGLAVIVILAIWASVLAMMFAFARVVRLAGWLIAPLLAWVSFATALNVAIWWLNR